MTPGQQRSQPPESASGFRAVALCFLFRDSAAGRQVLLGLKKTGFGTGRIVTLGGKIEPGETPAAAAVREVREESGIFVEEKDLSPLGTVRWSFPARPQWNMEAAVFTAERFSGTATDSDEVDPEWFPVDALPWEGMWDDAAYWLPQIIDGTWIDARIVLNPDNSSVAAAVVR